MIYLSVFGLQAVIILFMQRKFSDMDGRTVKLKLVDFIPFIGIGIFLFRYMSNFD